MILVVYSIQLGRKLVLSDNSSDESFIHDDSSSEDEKPWAKEVKKQYRLIKRKNETQSEEQDQSVEDDDERVKSEPRLYEIKEDVEFRDAKPVAKKQSKYVHRRMLLIENISSYY